MWSKHVHHFRLNCQQHNWGDLYDHSMSMRTFTSLMKKIFIWALKIMRKFALACCDCILRRVVYLRMEILVILLLFTWNNAPLVIAGKSTVTAMLGVALCSLGEDITAIVGAQVPQVWVNDKPNLFILFLMSCQYFQTCLRNLACWLFFGLFWALSHSLFGLGDLCGLFGSLWLPYMGDWRPESLNLHVQFILLYVFFAHDEHSAVQAH